MLDITIAPAADVAGVSQFARLAPSTFGQIVRPADAFAEKYAVSHN